MNATAMGTGSEESSGAGLGPRAIEVKAEEAVTAAEEEEQEELPIGTRGGGWVLTVDGDTSKLAHGDITACPMPLPPPPPNRSGVSGRGRGRARLGGRGWFGKAERARSVGGAGASSMSRPRRSEQREPGDMAPGTLVRSMPPMATNWSLTEVDFRTPVSAAVGVRRPRLPVGEAIRISSIVALMASRLPSVGAAASSRGLMVI